MVYDVYIFINSNLLSYKNWKENSKFILYFTITIHSISHNTTLSKGTIFIKNIDFLKKDAEVSKIKGVLVLKGMFSKTIYLFVLTHQISTL